MRFWFTDTKFTTSDRLWSLWHSGAIQIRLLLLLLSHFASTKCDVSFSRCHYHPIISCSIKIQTGLTFRVPAYPGCPGKETVKRESVYLTTKTVKSKAAPDIFRYFLHTLVTYTMDIMSVMFHFQPSYLYNLLQVYHPSRTLCSSTQQLLHVPYMSTDFGRRAFSYSSSATWNSIPISIKNCSSLYSFKRHLKSQFIAQLIHN